MKMKAILWPACVVLTLGSEQLLAQATVDCSSVAEDMARLKCYDEQSARQKKQASSPAQATSTPAPAKQTRSTQSTSPARAESSASSSSPSDFGLDADAIRKKQAAANPDAPQVPEQLVARVKAVVAKPLGNYRITLEDGQVWEETQHTGGLPPRPGETVTIKRGMLGSYFLSRSSGLALRVKRVD
jgi:hypothetical protein